MSNVSESFDSFAQPTEEHVSKHFVVIRAYAPKHGLVIIVMKMSTSVPILLAVIWDVKTIFLAKIHPEAISMNGIPNTLESPPFNALFLQLPMHERMVWNSLHTTHCRLLGFNIPKSMRSWRLCAHKRCNWF